MSKNSLRVFVIVAFLQTGISNSSVHIRQRQEGDRLNVTCTLSGKENLTQVTWEKQQDSNRTNMGVFHPHYGIYIESMQAGRVKIEGNQRPLAYSSLSVELEALNKSGQICCVFMTFPSGILRQCAKIGDSEEVIDSSATKTAAQGARHELGIFGQLGAVIIGSIISLVFFITSFYFCHRCCCRRRRVFNVEQPYLTDPPASTETHTEETPVQHATPGFDPTKLYAKIKEDFYYGRLWKSYQGRSRVPTQGSPSPPRQIYYRLGERPVPQREEEGTTKGPDTMTSSPSDTNN
ncbi:immunoglobulin domain-containing protein [Colossoma macropomum]|uniref:immunoglobulin domain-containing protein n=1 Tax=Colossoma macropomum TaxID=42526 RepID=UPI0018652404|nr:immunoglobulin domain-containing protein [Colossoma macropomum]